VPKAELLAEGARPSMPWSGPTRAGDTRQKKKFRKMLREGQLADKEIEIQVQGGAAASMPTFENPRHAGGTGSAMMKSRGDIWQGVRQIAANPSAMTVAESYVVLMAEESDKLLDNEEGSFRRRFVPSSRNGIVFLDEIDKITGTQAERVGADVSREGVQRDLPAADRGDDRRDQARRRQDRPHPVHRLGALSISRKPSDLAARAARPSADPGRAQGPDPRRSQAHSDRTGSLADQAVQGTVCH